MERVEEFAKEEIDEVFLDFLEKRIVKFGGKAKRSDILQFAKEIYQFKEREFIAYSNISLKEHLQRIKRPLSLSDFLEKARVENKKINLLNFYRGVPIENGGEILEFEDDVAVLKSKDIQLMAMKIQKKVFVLKDSLFPQNLKAEVDTVNFLNSTVTIRNLRYYFDTSFYERIKDLNLEPKYPLYIECIKEVDKKEAWIKRLSKNRIFFMSKSGDFNKGDIINTLPTFLDKKRSFKLKIEEKYFYEDYFHYSGICYFDDFLKRSFENLLKKIEDDAKKELKEELSYYLA